jgi:hypothetical protein
MSPRQRSVIISTCNQLIDLAGLSGLEYVGGSLQIQLNAMLTTLNGLQRLRHSETLSVSANPSLIHIGGLCNFQRGNGGTPFIQ